MEFGLFTEFESPAGMDQAVAFDESLAQDITYEDVLREQLIYGSPGEVADRLLACAKTSASPDSPGG